MVQAVEMASKNGILTQITTNGKQLSYEYIDALALAGLDMLSVSIDGVNNLGYSKKTIADNPELIELLKYAKEKYSIIVSSNAVLSKENANEVELLLELLHINNIPMSVGVIVAPPSGDTNEWNKNNINDDYSVIKPVLERLILKKESGYEIIVPTSYLKKAKQIQARDDKAIAWDCANSRKRSLQIGPSSKIYWCTKLLRYSPYDFNSMNITSYKKYKKDLDEVIAICSKTCYTNCGYFMDYYYQNKSEFIKKLLIPALKQRLSRVKKEQAISRTK